MKLSNDTLNILKNFASINTGIVFHQGKTIKTISGNKNILAEATITEEIPVEFGVYDLNNFLTVLSLHKEEPVIDFGDKMAVISGLSGRSKLNYRFCDPTMVVAPPAKPIAMPDAEIAFELSDSDLEWVIRSSSVLSSPNIAVVSDGSKISLQCFDATNDAASTNTLDVTDGNGDRFKMIFKTEALKMIPGSYDVRVSSKGVSHFRNKAKDLQYWITTEAGSTYSKA
jgi:gp45 sliding clamp, C terminal